MCAVLLQLPLPLRLQLLLKIEVSILLLSMRRLEPIRLRCLLRFSCPCTRDLGVVVVVVRVHLVRVCQVVYRRFRLNLV